MRLYTADRETGTFIEEVKDIETGLNLIKKYEADDENEGTYEPNFYDVVDENHCSMLRYVSNLKLMREEKGLSRSELSKLSGVGVRTIEAFEQGLRDINGARVVTVLSLADALECDVYEIVNPREIKREPEQTELPKLPKKIVIH